MNLWGRVQIQTITWRLSLPATPWSPVHVKWNSKGPEALLLSLDAALLGGRGGSVPEEGQHTRSLRALASHHILSCTQGSSDGGEGQGWLTGSAYEPPCSFPHGIVTGLSA